VKDAERHGVDVLPARVDASDWDCSLEGAKTGSGGGAGLFPDVEVAGDDPALRLGLRLVRGLGEEPGRRIEGARRQRPFASVEDLVARARLDKREVSALAQAGALVAFGLSRREAMWKVRAPRERDLLAGIELGDAMPELPQMSRAEQLVLDYASTGVAVGDHAMKVARPRLPAHVKSAKDLAAMPHGARVSTAGMVICRQRPGTASGVVFVTLEDETGFINLILWTRTFDAFRHVVTSSSMLLAHGKVERSREAGASGDVIYVVPDRIEALRLLDVPAMSRDFH
jgi:error-prone DNA polymerase